MFELLSESKITYLLDVGALLADEEPMVVSLAEDLHTVALQLLLVGQGQEFLFRFQNVNFLTCQEETC